MKLDELVESAEREARAAWRKVPLTSSVYEAFGAGFAAGMAFMNKVAAENYTVKPRETTTPDHTVKHSADRETFRK